MKPEFKVRDMARDMRRPPTSVKANGQRYWTGEDTASRDDDERRISDGKCVFIRCHAFFPVNVNHVNSSTGIQIRGRIRHVARRLYETQGSLRYPQRCSIANKST